MCQNAQKGQLPMAGYLLNTTLETYLDQENVFGKKLNFLKLTLLKRETK